MSSNTLSLKPVLYNSIPDQNKVYANQLTTQEWNEIINILKTQSNVNAAYVERLHNWLVGENGSVSIDSEASFVEYTKNELSLLDDRVIKNKLSITYLEHTKADKQDLSLKADKSTVDNMLLQIVSIENTSNKAHEVSLKAQADAQLAITTASNFQNILSLKVDKDLTDLPKLQPEQDRSNTLLYVDCDGQPTKLPVKELLKYLLSTVTTTPSTMQTGEYIFLKKEDNA